LTVQRARPKALDLGIQRLTQAADLALGDAVHPKCLDQLVDAPGAHALDVGLLHYRHQCAFATPPRLEQGWVVATVPNTRHPQFDAANACIPGPIAVPVALARAIGAALVALRTELLRHLDLHDLLGHHAYTLAQEIHVPVQLGLAQQLLKRHPQILGHRLWLPLVGDLVNPDGNHPVAVRVNGLSRKPTRPGTLLWSPRPACRAALGAPADPM